jgi:orotate phosphoribosyltransferase
LGALSLFTERENGVMLFRRGFSLPSGARVLVAEDVVTTGGSVFETMERVRKSGGVVIGVAALVDRSGGGVDFGVKTAAAYATEIISYPPDECPLCKAGAPAAVKPGSRAAADFRAPFLER